VEIPAVEEEVLIPMPRIAMMPELEVVELPEED
jgi:hypothetical protein